MKQKNLIIFIPSIEGGGVERNLFEISNYLSNKINHIKVITADFHFEKKFNKKIELISINKKIIPKFGRFIKYIVCLILLFIEIIKNKNNLVFSFQANFYCTLLCKILGTKIIIRSNSSPSGWSNNSIKIKIFKFLFKLPDLIIVNSINFKKEIKKKFNVNSIFIYNPVNSKKIKKLSHKKITFNFFRKNTLNIINVGRLVDQKDQMTLLKALNSIKKKIKFKLLIIGNGQLKNFLINYIKSNNLQNSIKIIKFKKNPFPYYKKSNLLILSSKFEGLPNVLIEALILDKHVISSDCPTGPSEILDNGKGGTLFRIGDFVSLGKKILLFKKRLKLNNSKLSYAKKRLDRFNHKKNLAKYLAVIKLQLLE